MRDWIAVIVAVLGVLLVLAGAVLIVLQALGERRPVAAVPDNADTAVIEAPAAPITSRLFGAVKSPTPADRLIFWGIILLVLAAIAAGAISFDFGAKGGS
ncbi:hypothetical protein ABT369_26920 [Dactylosporangium sp. NPDC000244]|uniref:hypothetical protein n=1 Tax=Dactylosporangium sp. NPDC000244 TaxID=3154365 RepID=UPI00332FA5F8